MVTPEVLRKYRGKSIAYLEDKAQDAVNKFVRKRDSINNFFVCISCQELKPINQMNAGHYYAKEFYKSVRYDLNNVNGQCVRCNKYLSGNLIEYRKNLLEKIGEENLKQLDKLAELKNFRFTREFLIELIEKYKNI
ncbi:MAG TPA: NinG protein [Flavobacteriaceae bacterium]|nr:NinG protein [Flavobacteriaceae bacterium]